MRLQLSASALRARGRGAVGLAIATALVAPRAARAQAVVVETAHTLWHEAPTRTNMTVYTPGASVTATPASWISVRGAWEADVVSGASVATKAGPAYQAVNPGVDVVTTASVKDFRQAPSGALTLRKGDVTYTASYTYGTENDYRSNSLFVGARTDVFQHNTQFDLSYARNWDGVCDRVQGASDTPPRFRALEDSSGCFTDGAQARTRRDLAIDGLQASWSQAWTPAFATQVLYTAQLLDGFQSNPYRSVILGQGIKAQEHHPQHRTRQSVTARANLYVRPLKLAVRISGRAYRDTWQIASGTGELEAERYLFEGFRIAARGRYYRQTGAIFWSDDYTGGDLPLGPKGQYWTGDRELSPFSSVGLGFRATYAIAPAKPIWIMSAIKASVAADAVQFDYDEYTLGGTPVTNARAYVLGANLSLSF
jgi:hypothetical protein